MKTFQIIFSPRITLVYWVFLQGRLCEWGRCAIFRQFIDKLLIKCVWGLWRRQL